MTPERTPEAVLDELAARSRRARPWLVIGLLLIVGSLAGSIFWLDHLRREAERNYALAQTELEKFKAARDVIDRAQTAPEAERAQILQQGLIEAEKAAAPARPAQTALETLKIDFFLCSGAPAAVSEQARKLLALRPAKAQPWQLRALSAATNAKWNYRLSGNEIRYNPEEEDAADWLVERSAASGISLKKVLTFFPTPGTMSLFLCEGVTPAPAAAPDNQG
ncbi:MAG: hypothetical protein EOP60_03555 [Sphingomonadales bacterium]|nr:MAG: hypothetical protein EOP60_03555 [Sphingomonadales bacterium]